ncbi:hypothetical protein V8E36_002301 [Tilletia maclaganii]
MVLLTAAPRHAAGYAFIDIGASSIRISLPDELPPQHTTDHGGDEPPKKKVKLSTSNDDSGSGGDAAEQQQQAQPVPIAAAQAAAQEAASTSAQVAEPAPLQLEAQAQDQDQDQAETPAPTPAPSDAELPPAHTTSRTGAAVTSSTAATAPANPHEPLHTMPNLIARGRSRSSSSGASDLLSSKKRIYVADQLLHECTDYSSLHLRSPFDRGFLADWAAQKVTLDRAITVSLSARPLAPRQALPYTHAMAARAARMTGVSAADVSVFDFGTDLESRLLEERTVIVTEPYFNFPDAAGAMDIMMFEQYGAAALWRVTPAQLIPFAPIFGSAPAIPAPNNTQALPAPDCILVVDLGHSSTTIVPLICAQAQWSAARRLDIGGKLLTNLLKETLSFRQWDMMDETWLVQAVKERCCFLAPCAGVRLGEEEGGKAGSVLGPDKSVIMPVGSEADVVRRRRNEVLRTIKTVPPRQWGLTLLVELCKLFPISNPVMQDYVLPDYSDAQPRRSIKSRPRDAATSSRALGYIRRGAGSKCGPTSRVQLRRQLPLSAADESIADLSMPCERKAPKTKSRFGSSFLARSSDDSDSEDDDEQDEDEDDDDFDPDAKGGEEDEDGDVDMDEDDAGSEAKSNNDDDDDIQVVSASRGQGAAVGNDDDAQILKMGNERFSVPEVLFAPSRLGLAQAPLHEVIAESIRACPEDVRDMMWSNIVLIGGGARLPGLRIRLEHELRMLAPDDIDVHIWDCKEPEKAAAQGALALLSAPPDSPEARFFRAHLVTRTEWANAGAAVCRARFGGWMAMHDATAHFRRMEDEDDEEGEDGLDGDGAGAEAMRAAAGMGRPSAGIPMAPEGPATGPGKSAKGKGKVRASATPFVSKQGQSANASSAAAVAAAVAPGVGAGVALPKKRGRPKGSKNKPREVVASTSKP